MAKPYSFYEVVAKPLFFPLITFIIAGIFYSHASPFFSNLGTNLLDKSRVIIAYGTEIFLWISFAWFICRLIDIFIWEVTIFMRYGVRVPLLIKESVHFVVYFIAILCIIAVVFDESVVGLLAASGAVSIVLGFSLQNLIDDILSSLIISIDRPFEIGDRVYFHEGVLAMGARVMETSWRSTSFTTDNQNILIIPNSSLLEQPLTNISKSPLAMYEFGLTLDGALPIKRVRRILEASVLAISEVKIFPRPEITIETTNGGGLNYTILFWTNSPRIDDYLRHELYQNIKRNFGFADIEMFIPQQIVYETKTMQEKTTPPHGFSFIRQIDIFYFLPREEIEAIGRASKFLEFSADTVVVKAGVQGKSMFLVVEGLLEVFIEAPEKKELISVAYLTAGQIFGEMSLLTGAPRSATVLCKTEAKLIEITKESLEPILKRNKEIIVQIAKIISERKTAQRNKIMQLEDLGRMPAKTKSQMIIEQIMRFFKIDIKKE